MANLSAFTAEFYGCMKSVRVSSNVHIPYTPENTVFTSIEQTSFQTSIFDFSGQFKCISNKNVNSTP